MNGALLGSPDRDLTFVTTIPEPSATALLAAAATALFWRRRLPS